MESKAEQVFNGLAVTVLLEMFLLAIVAMFAAFGSNDSSVLYHIVDAIGLAVLYVLPFNIMAMGLAGY